MGKSVSGQSSRVGVPSTLLIADCGGIYSHSHFLSVSNDENKEWLYRLNNLQYTMSKNDCLRDELPEVQW